MEHICPAGYFCEEGSIEPRRCKNGTYQDEPGKPVCKLCPGGFICDNRNLPVTHFNATLCPRGYFCPAGTEIPKPCPQGTYSKHEGLSNFSQCLSCPPGYICDDIGQTDYTKPCLKGYFCKKGCPGFAQDNDASEDYGPCPPGHYCPISTNNPVMCPPGTFSNLTKLENEDQCSPCSAGSFCSAAGLLQPDGLCKKGYYCQNGSKSSTEKICPKGYFCDEGSFAAAPCPIGTYNPLEGGESQTYCSDCPGGSYCEEPGQFKVNCML